jgi:hypothetical protein
MLDVSPPRPGHLRGSARVGADAVRPADPDEEVDPARHDALSRADRRRASRQRPNSALADGADDERRLVERRGDLRRHRWRAMSITPRRQQRHSGLGDDAHDRPDANPQSHVVTDNQGGTYTRVGDEKPLHQRRAGNTYVSQLWKRDQLSRRWRRPSTSPPRRRPPGSGTPASSSRSRTPAATRSSARRARSQATSSGSSFTMPNEGDLFCMDFCAGGGATSTISAGSGFTKIYERGDLRLVEPAPHRLASALQTQKAGRTYSFTTFESVTSVAMWFEGPKRSKPASLCSIAASIRRSTTPARSRSRAPTSAPRPPTAWSTSCSCRSTPSPCRPRCPPRRRRRRSCLGFSRQRPAGSGRRT